MTSSQRFKCTLSVLLLSLVPASGALGQTALGGITGVVRDKSSAVIPGSLVTVGNLATGVENRVETGADGTYQVLSLQVGDYRVSASAAGFKRLDIMRVRINAGTIVTQSLTLDIGDVSESISVSGQTQMVQTTSGEVGSTVQVEQIREMPLPDRNVFNLTNLVPGAYLVDGVPSIGGGRVLSASVYVDGVISTKGGFGTSETDINPPIDAMQEFKVQVNSMGADQGRSSGGTVSAVTRSGTNEFHGTFYEFVRNDKFDAAGWNQTSKPKLRRNNFGGTVGGPIKRNKAFFFYNYDLARERQQTKTTRDVGLPEFQEGDFSNATALIGGQRKVVPIFDPASGTGAFSAPAGTLPFSGNRIPRSRFDAVAASVLQGRYIPAANKMPNNTFNNSGNWQRNLPTLNNSDMHTAKVDLALSDDTRMFVRYIRNPTRLFQVTGSGYGPADPDQVNQIWWRQSLASNVTHVFTPTFLLNATGGFFRQFTTIRGGDCCDTNYAAKFSLPEVSRIGGEAFPRFDFGGGLVPVTQVGVKSPGYRRVAFNTFDYKVDLTNLRGNHSLKFGFVHLRFQGNELLRQQPSGVFNFNGRWTQQYDAQGRLVNNTGIRFADFLLGRLNSVSARVSGTIGKRIRYYAGYFQDDWRVTPNLTLNLGLRYETETPISEVANRISGFDRYAPSPLAGQNGIPAGAVGIAAFAGQDGHGKYLWNWDKNNVAPRFGFAWRMRGTDALVLRGGYGIYYGNPYDGNTIQNIRASYDKSFTVNHPVPFALSDGIPAGALDDVPASERNVNFGARGTRFAASSVEFIDPARQTPYSHNANLNLQTQAGSWMFEVGVTANLGRQVSLGNININQIRPQDLPRLDPRSPDRATAFELRPNQTLTSDQPVVNMMAANWGISNAWMGTLRAERRFQNGFGMTLAYTYTSWIDNIPNAGARTLGDNDPVQDIYNHAGERSRSTVGAPHRLVLGPIWDVPFGRGRLLGSGWHPVLNAVAGGWQVSGIATLRSGAPFGVEVFDGPKNLLNDTATGRILRPNYAPGISGSDAIYASGKGGPLTNGNTGIAWLNSAAFSTPAPYTLGSVSRTVPGILGPGVANLEFMLAKNFRWGDRWRCQFRWEMFNLFNSPQWEQPAQSLGGGGFGEISGAGGRRIMQLGLKLYW